MKSNTKKGMGSEDQMER